MYCNFVLIDNNFLQFFSQTEQENIKEKVYDYYLQCGKSKTKKLSIEDYFKSTHVKYKFVYTYCPKCKESGIILFPFKKNGLGDLKYCASCGEGNISYRFQTGWQKVDAMLAVSELVQNIKFSKASRDLNQQILTLIVSVLEVYLRDCYAGILNTRFVAHNNTLFDKFVRDCKNDFLNPGKANERYKKEISLDLMQLLGNIDYKKWVELAEYRNVIIHNNGLCDAKFISTGIGSYKLHDTITLSQNEIKDYIQVVDRIVKTLDFEYCHVIQEYIVLNIKIQLVTNAPELFAVYVPSKLKRPIIMTSCDNKSARGDNDNSAKT